MYRIISLLFVSSLAFAQPRSIHFSALGNYLVDQDGNKTTIQGHPYMICHQGFVDMEGVFQKARGATIWLIDGTRYIRIDKPVCDLEDKEK